MDGGRGRGRGGREGRGGRGGRGGFRGRGRGRGGAGGDGRNSVFKKSEPDAPRISSEVQIFVEGLPAGAKVPELVQYFSTVGEIKVDRFSRQPRVHLYKDKETGQVQLALHLSPLTGIAGHGGGHHHLHGQPDPAGGPADLPRPELPRESDTSQSQHSQGSHGQARAAWRSWWRPRTRWRTRWRRQGRGLS